jgi:GT2 family glycosyltransferase
MEKIAVCVPVKESVSTEFLGSFLNLVFSNMKKYEIIVSFSELFPIDTARNDLVERALKYNPDYIFFIDSDMILPDNILDDLVCMEKDIASALYFMKVPPYKPIAKIMKGKMFCIINSIPLNQVMEVDAVGLGCCLIKKEVFEKMKEKNEKMFRIEEQKINDKVQLLGEDTFFCLRAKESGFKIFLNTGLICKHIGKSLVDENFYKLYLNIENKDK